MLFPRQVEIAMLQESQGGPDIGGRDFTHECTYGVARTDAHAPGQERLPGVDADLGAGGVQVLSQGMELLGDDQVLQEGVGQRAGTESVTDDQLTPEFFRTESVFRSAVQPLRVRQE